MNEEEISVRNFLRNYKKLASQNKTFIILNHGKREGVYTPYQEWQKDNNEEKVSIEELEKFAISDPNIDPNLSQKVDEIYEYPNPLKSDSDWCFCLGGPC